MDLRTPPGLTVVVADPGWGKTRFVDAWVARHRAADQRFDLAHVAGRNDLARYLEPGRAPDDRPLAIDDLHLASAIVRDLVERHLRARPSGAPTLVSTRSSASVDAIANDGAAVTLVRSSDLAMSTEDVGTALGFYAGSRLDAAMVHTEGWPMAVELLRRRKSYEPIGDLTGATADELAYVHDEYVTALDADARRLLRRMAEPDEFDPATTPLAGPAEVGSAELGPVLAGLAAPHGFVRLRPDGRYRLHPILRDALRRDTRRAAPAVRPTADPAPWGLVAGDAGSAAAMVERELAQGHWDEALELLIEGLGVFLLAEGPERVHALMERIPGVAAHRGPEASLHYAVLCLGVGDHQTASHLLARRPITDRDAPAGVRAMATLSRAFLGMWAGPPADSRVEAQRAVVLIEAIGADELPPIMGIYDTPSARRIALAVSARHAITLDRWDEALDDLGAADTGSTTPVADYVVGAISSWLRALRGETREALEQLAIAREVMAFAQPVERVAVEPHLTEAELALARGDLDDARAAGERARSASERLRAPHQIAAANLVMADTALRSRRFELALTLLTPTPRARLAGLEHRAAGIRARSLLRLGRLTEAAEALGGVAVGVHTAVAHAELVVAGAGGVDPEELRSWEAPRWRSAALARHLALAILDTADRPEEAAGHLERALDLAQDAMVGAFLQVSPATLALAPPRAAAAAAGFGDLDLPRLSARQLVVLKRLAQPGDPRTVAADLYISPNTLKSHSRHIYRTLGASGRAEAVAIARRLGLI